MATDRNNGVNQPAGAFADSKSKPMQGGKITSTETQVELTSSQTVFLFELSEISKFVQAFNKVLQLQKESLKFMEYQSIRSK